MPSSPTSGLEVLFDDRDARPGVKFADAELIGSPAPAGRSPIEGCEAGELEYRHRRDAEARHLKREEALKIAEGRRYKLVFSLQ